MEASREEGGWLEKLQPPRLEDAGLENCALPPESIREAFFKAATAICSSASSILTTSDDEEIDNDEIDATKNNCVKDPHPVTKEQYDSMIGKWSEFYPSPGRCEVEKGGGVPEVAASMTDAEERVVDKVMVGTKAMDGGEACVDGLKGLKIGEKGKDEDDRK